MKKLTKQTSRSGLAFIAVMSAASLSTCTSLGMEGMHSPKTVDQSAPVSKQDAEQLKAECQALHDTMMANKEAGGSMTDTPMSKETKEKHQRCMKLMHDKDSHKTKMCKSKMTGEKAEGAVTKSCSMMKEEDGTGGGP